MKHTQDDEWAANLTGRRRRSTPVGALERAPQSLRQQMRVQTMPVKARKCSALRSWRRWRRRQTASQAMVRSTVQR
ncbi:hypothetical protein A4U61_04505 [Streptomyces sp. H-KF8]|nr:hypothetical protein A4U61_04505 [Streptomyces sp. H-KF8]